MRKKILKWKPVVIRITGRLRERMLDDLEEDLWEMQKSEQRRVFKYLRTHKGKRVHHVRSLRGL